MASALAIYCEAADRANNALVGAIIAGELPLGSLPIPAQTRLAQAGTDGVPLLSAVSCTIRGTVALHLMPSNPYVQSRRRFSKLGVPSKSREPNGREEWFIRQR